MSHADHSRGALRVAALYPETMNIYADRGNITFLRRRCQARGIAFEYSGLRAGDAIDPAAHDLFYIGGGQDRDQRLVAADLNETKRAGLAAAVNDGAVVLAVCGGYQLLGHAYRAGEIEISGLGLIDATTVNAGGERLIGDVEIEVVLPGDVPGAVGRRILAGFENHGGRTSLGATARPLGRVLLGHGNNGEDGAEGVRHDNVFATYLHGPLLPKNAWFADYLTALALGRRAGEPPALEPLDDALEDAAHRCARDAVRRSHRVRYQARKLTWSS